MVMHEISIFLSSFHLEKVNSHVSSVLTKLQKVSTRRTIAVRIQSKFILESEKVELELNRSVLLRFLGKMFSYFSDIWIITCQCWRGISDHNTCKSSPHSALYQAPHSRYNSLLIRILNISSFRFLHFFVKFLFSINITFSPVLYFLCIVLPKRIMALYMQLKVCVFDSTSIG